MRCLDDLRRRREVKPAHGHSVHVRWKKVQDKGQEAPRREKNPGKVRARTCGTKASMCLVSESASKTRLGTADRLRMRRSTRPGLALSSCEQCSFDESLSLNPRSSAPTPAVVCFQPEKCAIECSSQVWVFVRAKHGQVKRRVLGSWGWVAGSVWVKTPTC